MAEKEARLDLPIFEAKVKELVGLMSAPHKMNAEEPTRSGVHSSPVVSRLAPTGPAASQDMEIWRWLVKLWPSARARETKLSFLFTHSWRALDTASLRASVSTIG